MILLDIRKVNYNHIDEQIQVREDLINEMVGSLYPAVLRGEIEKLRRMKNPDFISEEEMEV